MTGVGESRLRPPLGRSPALAAVGAERFGVSGAIHLPPAACGWLSERFEAHIRFSDLIPKDVGITIALSGGLDSVVLFDLLLGMAPSWGWRITAAHFDHRLRARSDADARWVEAFCARQGIVCCVGRSSRIPANEADARELRYAFLAEARAELGGEVLVTAHQADDQAETVLFRLLRGSGLRGLAGIPARRSPNIVRPLLPFWREEIAEHARVGRLTFLSDPTNRDVSITRNWLRHRLIPDLEARDGPGFRRDLVRLGGLASRALMAVSRRVESAADRLELEASEGRIVVARTSFRAYDSHVGAHILRALVARVGPRPGRVGTRLALEFINTGSSGRQIQLTGGVTLRREFDRLIFESRDADGGWEPDRDLVIAEAGSGAGTVRIGGVDWRVRWSEGAAPEAAEPGDEVAHFEPSQLDFPLAVRGWRPGDRIQTPVGTRKLKKVFGDRKVGRSERRWLPLVADRAGVLWVVGQVRAARAVPTREEVRFAIRFRRES